MSEMKNIDNLDNMKRVNNKTMTASEYYYDCTFDTWDNMLYPEAIKDRAERCKNLYFELYKKESPDQTFDEKIRFYKVEKAYQDTAQLVNERTLLI